MLKQIPENTCISVVPKWDLLGNIVRDPWYYRGSGMGSSDVAVILLRERERERERNKERERERRT